MKFWVKVSPRSKRSGIVGIENDTIKIALKSPPVEGRANKELIEILSEKLKVPKKNIRILRGEKSRKKLIEVTGIEDFSFSFS